MLTGNLCYRKDRFYVETPIVPAVTLKDVIKQARDYLMRNSSQLPESVIFEEVLNFKGESHLIRHNITDKVVVNGQEIAQEV